MVEATIEDVLEFFEGTAGRTLESYNFASFAVHEISCEIVRP